MTNGSIPWLRWFGIRELFRFTGSIRGLQYFVVGLTLAILKYAVEFTAVWVNTGKLFSPIDFVSPMISSRAEYLRGSSDFLGIFWILFSIPFVYICRPTPAFIHPI